MSSGATDTSLIFVVNFASFDQEYFVFLFLTSSPLGRHIYLTLTPWCHYFPLTHSHFVPLCRTMDSTAPVIPSHCQPAVYRCSKEIARQYINYREDNSFTIGAPVQYTQIEPTHLFNTMGCRFKPHKPKQPGFFHGLIDKLVSASYQELSKETALENLFSLCSSLDRRDGRDRLESSKGMIATDLLIKVIYYHHISMLLAR